MSARRPTILLLTLSTLVFLASMSGVARAATLVVDEDGQGTAVNCDATDEAHETINEAINAAADGDVIVVCPGTYAEQVVIDVSVDVVGSGPDASVIENPGGLATHFGTRPIVAIGDSAEGEAVDASLQDLTVAGPETGADALTCNEDQFVGIHVSGNDTATISGVDVRDIRNDPLNGCQEGHGIIAGDYDDFDVGATVDIQNVDVTDHQKSGIVLWNEPTVGTVTNTDVTGAGSTPLIAQNGIQVSDGAAATIDGSSSTNHQCTQADCGDDPFAEYGGAGLVMADDFGEPSLTVTDTVVSDNDVGAYTETQFSIGGGSTVAGNLFFGIYAGQGTNSVHDTTITQNGIGLLAASLESDPADVTVENAGNVYSQNDVAIQVEDEDETDTADPVVEVHLDQISGNDAGVVNNTDETVDAENNWWGDASGPSGAGPGTGDSVTANVDFDPWCDNPQCDAPEVGGAVVRNVIRGTPGNDRLFGTPGRDIIRGLGGNDRINGLGNNDRLFGGAGNDKLRGGSGADRLFGQGGNDRLKGGGGPDKTVGGGGNDRCHGNAGRDRGNCERERSL